MTDERTPEQVKADQDYYDALLEMMSTTGWKNLTAEFEQTKATLNDVVSTNSAEELWTRKGQLNILNNLLNLRTSIDFAMDQLEADNSDEDN